MLSIRIACAKAQIRGHAHAGNSTQLITAERYSARVEVRGQRVSIPKGHTKKTHSGKDRKNTEEWSTRLPFNPWGPLLLN